GRVLIWLVSLKMISEKPFCGWGEYGFSSSYMRTQAIFLKDFPEGRISYLADNISHPFNEFLLVCINYGVIGLVILLFMITVLAKQIVSGQITHKSLYLAILSTLIVLSMFSYPFTVPIIWLTSTFLICSVICNYCMNSSPMRIPMVSLLAFTILLLLFQNRHIYHVWQWQKIQTSSSPIEVTHKQYQRLHSHLDRNPSFLYNYGAWLHYNGYHQESLCVLSECVKTYDDYNVELLIADNYRELGKTKKAIEIFEYANAMIPCRFLPLYHEMKTHEANEDYDSAIRIAKKIVSKPIKIEHSASVKKIIHEAEDVIHKWEADLGVLNVHQENEGQDNLTP
ncbi:MAG: O-antigen ligase family protein, partial [Prevotellaceae bacterium]|nr:O-antigen ligase family protein [Prevotellaceae bacterium]